MTQQEKLKTCIIIETRIDEGKITDAIDNLEWLLVETGGSADALNSWRDTYVKLLYYFSNGYQDPMRQKYYNRLAVALYETTDFICRILQQQSSRAYYAILRTRDEERESLSTVIDKAYAAYHTNDYTRRQYAVNILFEHIWTSSFLTDDDVKRLRDQLTMQMTTAIEREYELYMKTINCQIVAALSLGLQELFDIKKLCLLFDAAQSLDDEVKIRAYVGILIVLSIYKKRVNRYPEIKHRLDNLSDEADFKNIIHIIIRRFILSRDTEKISERLKNEIFPEVLKFHEKFKQDLQSKNPNAENLDEMNPSMNPEWMKSLTNSPFADKLIEIDRLQEEGADVMHETFANFKNYPFFNHTGNWFLPFNLGLSLYPNKESYGTFIKIMAATRNMCNSDLYSMYFGMKKSIEKEHDKLLDEIEPYMDEYVSQQLGDMQALTNRLERIASQYTQDLYRFYKLHPQNDDFFDIFDMTLDFHNIDIIREYLYDRELYLQIADYYLQKNYFKDALIIYANVGHTPDGEETLCQKRGYCKQMIGIHQEALDEYLKAELINPDSKWLLRRIAQCYRAVRMPEKAVEYYLRIAKLEPDNLSVLMNVGYCYIDMEDYTTALNYYFKVDYLDVKSRKAWRPIAWCLFLAGKYEQAREYYKKIQTSDSPTTQDFMNAGHVEMVTGDISMALTLYRQSLNASGKDINSFINEFNKDRIVLTNAGIMPDYIALMQDCLRYNFLEPNDASSTSDNG